MNLLKMNIKDYLPHIIDAYTKVIGEKYSPIIFYRNLEGVPSEFYFILFSLFYMLR